MNIKITKEQHERLCLEYYEEYLFGSQLHGIASKESDFDYLRVISDAIYESFNSLGRFLPNIHSFQYTESKEKQYLWMTESQFWRNFFSGEGNLHADIILFSGKFENALHLCYSYKVIKGYIGTAKRDLKLHGSWDKKRFHAVRSFYMAEKLMKKEIPQIEDIKRLYKEDLPTTEELKNKETELRGKLNDMLNKGEIDLYPTFNSDNDLIQLLLNANNIKEFKY
jgi:predicted nucleotidyltransferase